MFKKGSWDNGAPRDLRKYSSVFIAGFWKKESKCYKEKKTQIDRPLFTCEVKNTDTQICFHNRYRDKE